MRNILMCTGVVMSILAGFSAGCSSSEQKAPEKAVQQSDAHAGHDSAHAVTPAAATAVQQLVAQKTCPVMGGGIDKSVFVDHEGKRVYFCCTACPAEFKKDPAKYLKKLEELGETPEKL